MQEQTATWLESQAKRAGRSLMSQSGRILDAVSECEMHLRPVEQALLEQLLGEPTELTQLLQQALRARAAQDK